MFKVGDVVVWKEKANYFSAKKGAKAKVVGFMRGGEMLDVVWLDEEANGQMDGGYSIESFEPNQTKPAFDMLTQPWFINVTQETFPAVNQWLKENYKGDQLPISYLPDRSNYLTNTTYSGSVEKRIMHGSTNKNLGKEIVLEVEYRVTKAVFPVLETEAQKKMKELENKQREIAEELAKLRESI